jgi:TrkA domain protein
MHEVTETQLPGVGVRYEFVTDAGVRVGAVVHRSGRRELVVYDAADPDVCSAVMQLTFDDARTMAELLGATRVSEVTAAVQQEIEGLSIDWVRVSSSSEFAGRTIADGMIRSNTGVSIVAVVRGTQTVPAPEPDFAFEPGDVAVAVGTSDGLAKVRAMFDA